MGEHDGTRYADNLRDLEAAKNGSQEAVAALMENNAGLIRGIALRFRGRGVEFDDLVQLGSIGMLKAIRTFDPSRNTAFSTYAVPLILGEIRRYLRDDGPIKVGRKQKRMGAALLRARSEFAALHGREPQLHELAETLEITDEEAALSLEAISPVHSISESLGDEDDGFSLENLLSGEDPIERRTDQLALAEAIRSLPPEWRKILTLRFFREFSQQQTADLLGLTQVKISREEKKIFAALRRELTR